MKKKTFTIRLIAVLIACLFIIGEAGVCAPPNIFSKPRAGQSGKKSSRRKSDGRKAKKKKPKKKEDKPVELTDSKALDIPSAHGTIIETWDPKDDGEDVKLTTETPLIVHLQDAHANIQAQKKEADILDHVIKTYGINVILVEGGITDKDFSYLRDQFTLEERKARAKRLLNEGSITAESYIDMATNYILKFQGIEDRELYEKNMEAYLKVDRFKEGGVKVLGQIETVVNTLKPAVYPQQLLELEQLRSEYDNEGKELSEYVLALREEADASKTDLGEFENFSAIARVAELEPDINFKKVEKERKLLVDKLSRKLSKGELSKLLSKSMDFKTKKVGQGEYHAYLIELANKARIPTAEYRQVALYADYASENDSIDSRKLLEELDKVYEALAEAYAAGAKPSRFARFMPKALSRRLSGGKQEAVELLEISQDLRVLKKFAELKLTPDEFDSYKSGERDFDVEAWPETLSAMAKKYSVRISTLPDMTVIKRNLPSLEDFYSSSFERDYAFIRNSLKKLKKEKSKYGILICGGFHTPHLTELFKENNIAYVVVAPKVEKATDDTFYREKLIEGYKSRLWDQLE